MNVGIIGFGNMGRAIAERIKLKFQVGVFDKDASKTRALKKIKAVKGIKELVKKSEVIVLAVKPQDLDSVLQEIKAYVTGKLVVSIAAGITLHFLESRLEGARIMRVMPNLPAKVGEGMICLSKSRNASDKDAALAQRIFSCVGKTMMISEKMMNEDTAISGSGPGYYYEFCPKTYDKGEFVKFEEGYFIPSLSASAQALGFTKKEADFLAVTTAKGSRVLFIETKTSPKELKKQVTSKGGTTEAALKVFQKARRRPPGKKIWIQAVKAAVKRAKQLSSP